MRRVLFIIFALTTSLFTFGQATVNGSFEELKNVSKINLEIDFSNAIIHGMTEKDFSIYEKDWYKDQPEIYHALREPMQDKLKDRLCVGKLIESPYKIKVCVSSINNYGDYHCYAVITNNTGNTIATISKIKGAGGVFGSKLNLIKDGAKSVGKILGDILKRELRKVDHKK